MSVCHEIAYFPYSKDLVVSHVYSYIPYSKELVVSMFLDIFRTQRNWPIPCFLTLLYSKDLVVSHVYRHFQNSKVSGNSKTTKSLEVFNEFGQISCFWTLSAFKRVWKQQNDKIP